MFDIFDSHVFGDDFFVLSEHESNFALFLVNKYFKQIDKFPRVRDKEAFVSAFKHVEVPLSVGDLSFDIADD
jgi:hypothetical protein